MVLIIRVGGFAPQTGISSLADLLVGGLKEDGGEGGEEGEEKVSLRWERRGACRTPYLPHTSTPSLC